MSNITIGAVIVALTQAKKGETSKRTAKEILAEVERVFPLSKTSLKSIYSTVCREGIKMPGSNRAAVDVEAFKELMSRLNPKPVEKTGTSDKK